jgi:hypothetical protein
MSTKPTAKPPFRIVIGILAIVILVGGALHRPVRAAMHHANMLRAAYHEGDDLRPTLAANQAVGPLFAGFVIRSAQSYQAAWRTE